MSDKLLETIISEMEAMCAEHLTVESCVAELCDVEHELKDSLYKSELTFALARLWGDQVRKERFLKRMASASWVRNIAKGMLNRFKHGSLEKAPLMFFDAKTGEMVC